MKQSPFQFLGSGERVERLCRSLEGIGLRLLSRNDDELTFECDWLATPVRIRWHLGWWPDGENQEDKRIAVTHENRVLMEIDVEALLRDKLASPLSDVIIDRVTHACSEVTGRRA